MSDDDWGTTDNSKAAAKPKQTQDDDDWGDSGNASSSVKASDDWGGDGQSSGFSGSRGGGGRGRGRGGYSNQGDRDGGERPKREPRPGDWTCPGCNGNNFSNKTECFKCHEAKPEGLGGSDGDRPKREPRPGDWTCPGCNGNNFSNKTECFKCHEAKPEGLGDSGGERPKREPRPGDWACPGCYVTNFSNKTECFKCGEAKPEGLGDSGERPKREPRPGDWECPSCKVNNFSNKTECFKCQEPKPEGLPEAPPKVEAYIPPEPTNNEEEMFGAGISAGINFDQYDKIEVATSGDLPEGYKPVQSFKEAKLRDFLMSNIEKSKYTKPTPIQKHALPMIATGKDLMACAQTGSGKTAAFILPILNKIMNESPDGRSGEPLCLIVAPTRELAIQIADEARKFSNQSWVRVTLAYGGTASRYQGERIESGCHILVATPGRLTDFVNKGIIKFSSLMFLVLDEADRMLDMGFKPSIDMIIEHASFNKETVQTLLFSATFKDEIQRLAANYLKDYLFLSVGIVGGACSDVSQDFIEVEKFKKRGKLGEILGEYVKSADEDRIMVFCETKKTADFLASFMSETKMSATSIHGDRTQRERESALRDFRTGRFKVLIATSVAARGLDIRGVTHVINYDLPKEIEDYVHRIGRTGRVGNPGKATSFYDPTQDQQLAPMLVQKLKDAGQPVPEFLGSSAAGGCDDDFGARDIRKGRDEGTKQVDDEEW